MTFLKNILSTVIGIFVFFLVLIFGLVFIAAIFGGNSEKVSVEKNSVIELDLSEVDNDYAGKFNFKDFNYFESNNNGLSEIGRASCRERVLNLV